MNTDLDNKKKKLIDSDSEDSSEEELPIVDYENFLTKQLRVPLEPRLFPLYVNGRIVDYNLKDYVGT